ncbi:MAG TPA: glycosyltransferase 87 family protein [Acidobacteriaceae bacterium]|nr:glycosyltransferase 87 family protein [Acidobacteriaceae bacterium]
MSSTKAAGTVENALWLYAFLLFITTVASWFCYLHFQTYDTRPLYTRQDQFRDLTNYFGKTANLYHGAARLGRAGFPIFNYPPPGAFVMKALLYASPQHPVRTDLLALATCILCFAFVALRSIGGGPAVRLAALAAVGMTAVLGYPHVFVADRGNTEWVVFALSGAGLCLLLAGRSVPAAVFLGLAGSIKPFPLLFLFPLIRSRKYKEVAIALSTAAVTALAALIYLGPNPWQAYQYLTPGVKAYTEQYVMSVPSADEMRFEHSILDGMKFIAVTARLHGLDPYTVVTEMDRMRNQPGGWGVVPQLVMIYKITAIPMLVVLLWRFYRAPILNYLIFLSVAITVFPPVAAEYGLLHLYVPFGAFLVFLTHEVSTGQVIFPKRVAYVLASTYALLFSPLTFLHLYAGFAKLCLLLLVGSLAMRHPMRSRSFDASLDT